MPKFVKVSDSKLPIEELHLGFLNYKLRNEFGFLESSKNNMPLNNKGEIIPMYTYPCYEYLNSIDLTKVIETSDETNLQDQAACAGGACEIV